GLTPSPALLIEKLSPRLPGNSAPGMFEGSWPGNDGGIRTSVRFILDQPGKFTFLGVLAQKIFQICRRQS
ncbi:MAG: hypothetical protein R6V55_16555, partial [Desulfovermiculus sp.]